MARNKRAFKRSDRVSQQIHEVVARVLLTEFEQPALREVQITAVTMTTDIRNATIYYLLLGADTDRREVHKLVERMTPAVRRFIGEQLDLQFVPAVKFVYDESVERGRRMEALLAAIDKPQDPPAGS